MKINKSFKSLYFLFIFLICIKSAISQIAWPLAPRDQQHWVVGSQGEFRESNRFHQGTDVSGNGTAYAINAGTVLDIRGKGTKDEKIVIGNVTYYHVNSGNIIKKFDEIAIGDEIGTVNPLASHVHIQRTNFNFLSHGLSPYVDNTPPVINYVEFRQNGASFFTQTLLYDNIITINNFDYTLLYDKIDIIADAKDPCDNNHRMAPISLSYHIFNYAGNPVGDLVNSFNFRTSPVNERASNCFYYGSILEGVFKYILTSSPTTGIADRYLLTRLDKKNAPQNSWPDNNSLAAPINTESYYPDGIYSINVVVFDADYDSHTNNNNTDSKTKQILIDNFRPYISLVKIKEYGATAFKYSRGWQWVNNNLRFEPLPNPEPKFDNNKDVEIEVTTSEPMNWVNITLNGYLLPQVFGSNLNKTKWTFAVPKIKLITGRNHIIIDGCDLANNQIQANPASIPIRQSDNNWTLTPNPGTDNYHSFIFGNTPVDFVATQLGSPENMMRFTDKSIILTSTYNWDFGDWSTNSTLKNVDHQYTNPGVYNVTHSAAGVSVAKYVSVNELSKPESKFIYSPLFTGSGKSPTVAVDFFSTSEGIISTYSWNFGNGLPITEQNPKGIVFDLNSHPIVTLTVNNGIGSDTDEQELNLDPSTFPFASIFDWEVNYFLHDLEIATSNFDISRPLVFEINFGDGTSQTVEDVYNKYYTFSHQYFNMGRYLVVAKVTQIDNNGKTIQVANAKEISVYPNELDVQILHQSANEPPYPLQNVDFSALIEPSGDYYGNWAIYRQGDPQFYFSQNFNSYTPELSYSFPQAGVYKIVIDVYTSGGPGSGHAEIEVEVVNAPKYLDVDLFGPNSICQNSSYTYTARLWPIGEPGVPDNEWYATNLRWTLFYPNGAQVVCNDCSKVLHDYQSQDLQYHEFNFTESGTYKLRLEAWNDQHGYEPNQLNPAYANSLSFYDFAEKEITVSNSFPALEVITPAVPYIDNVSADGNEDIELAFTNPGTSSITWDVISSNTDCVVIPIINSGLDLRSGCIVNMTLDVLPNLSVDGRGSVITINGRDMDGNHVQGSPAYIQIYQNGTDGAYRDYILGQSPGYAFGYSVSIDGLVMVIGAPASSGKGKALIYQKNEFGDWVNLTTLLPSDNNPNFGKSVDISGDYVIVAGEGSTSAYIFKKPLSGWSGNLNEIKMITNWFSDNSRGLNVSLWGDYAAIGVPCHEGRGIVQVYYRNEGGIDNWGHVKRLDGPVNDDQFGESVDLYNDVLAVGAPQGGWNQGFINMYDRNLNYGDSWGLIQTLGPQSASSEPNMKFGQRVSIFNDAIVSSYHSVYDSYGHNMLRLPIWKKNSSHLFELVGEAFWWLRYQTYFNCIGALSLYKDMNSTHPPTYNFRTLYGSEFRNNSAGYCGFANFRESSGTNYNYTFQWQDEVVNNIPGDLYGKSVSRSFCYDIVGIPGYSQDGYHGAIVFQKFTTIKSNFEAGIDFSFCNFTKPAGYYSTVNAANISLGGESLPAVIESGAIIQYEAGEILLKDGFIADHGSNFTAVALQQPAGPGMGPGTDESEPGIKELLLAQYKNTQILRTFQRAYPDFPWMLYNPVDDFKISIPEKTPIIAVEDKFNLELQMKVDTTPELSPEQSYYILNLPGNDKKLSLPVNSDEIQ